MARSSQSCQRTAFGTRNVTLPSDVSGMTYEQYERSIEEVAYSVIKDLKASGYEVA